MTTAPKQRPKYYDLNLAHLPAPGLASIFHRISGALLFFPVVPALLYLLQSTLGSEAAWLHWKDVLSQPSVKVILLGFVWLYAHHFFAGLRYLLLDVDIGIDKPAYRQSAWAVILAAPVLAVVLLGVLS